MPEKTAPYLRIAAEIRRRVADGELSPGDRVPSTRQIAREWNVALATAAKVLTTLAQEGVVRPEPRVGTVVAGPAPAPAVRQGEAVRPARPATGTARGARKGAGGGGPHPGEISRERVVRAAIEIADREGLEAVSMRAVAARLGAATMSIYRYVRGKDDLVMLMADAAYGEAAYPGEVAGGRRERLELVGRTLWTLFRRHPWLAQVNPLTRPVALEGVTAHGERLLSALDGLGLPATRVMDLQVLFYSYVQGMAIHLEEEARAEAASGLSADDWVDLQQEAFDRIAASGRYPVFARILSGLRDGYDLDLDALFEMGLRALLDGLAVHHPALGVRHGEDPGGDPREDGPDGAM
ncbi:TetR/AcrR family transcriptional regulator C-terminal domain-containing protein [Bailinhaonella thermotolerans]|uniref:GntR family transcriptional regulator n=1 Tax=Bailinhaonella thermotolerans TaxID=1070861 RepID=A0A3A4B612_9ACTN|nr:TetR/AcrR family transcriptional regulator C-terminal domain-containing protein [Bailinhaonella thermotolerans]RJL33481.1 GntR family transcriptional regulator [Bailinhaonella thermotolerans]